MNLAKAYFERWYSEIGGYDKWPPGFSDPKEAAFEAFKEGVKLADPAQEPSVQADGRKFRRNLKALESNTKKSFAELRYGKSPTA